MHTKKRLLVVSKIKEIAADSPTWKTVSIPELTAYTIDYRGRNRVLSGPDISSKIDSGTLLLFNGGSGWTREALSSGSRLANKKNRGNYNDA